jgi:hypothetical protein
MVVLQNQLNVLNLSNRLDLRRCYIGTRCRFQALKERR